ncbi:ABC transporter substrate-binding protein [Allonocardiopsis opalescens]|uniref:Iron complex transport system substrate-binding protein n=1 Tax=Allonocardiopsis opalescens TaxID=1144618 RepID=A0A2T0Q1U4_9ACTN|nr:ABC transporter substrate-binding protein [Allonocardiopsis opalescens]PRX97767.1 iron complex transport system substrate-binding protein [Allonocardiopsis opalescens]
MPPARAVPVIAAVAASLSLAAACGTAAEDGAEAAAPSSIAPVAEATPVEPSLSITDHAGTEITLAAVPERIVCLTGLCDDILLELGLRPVASTSADLLALDGYLGEQAGEVETIGGGFGTERPEDIVRQDPDLVIGLAGVHEQLAPALEAHAPLWNLDASTYTDSIAYLRDLARLTGRGEQQAAAEQRFATALTDARQRAEQRGAGELTVLSMYGGVGTIGVDTDEVLPGNLLAQVFHYPWPSLGGGFETAQAYSVEQILAEDPDVIFIQSFGDASVAEEYADDPVWNQITAVRDDRVYEVDPALWGTGRGTRAMTLILDQAIDQALQ